jgi:hypothetical protein
VTAQTPAARIRFAPAAAARSSVLVAQPTVTGLVSTFKAIRRTVAPAIELAPRRMAQSLRAAMAAAGSRVKTARLAVKINASQRARTQPTADNAATNVRQARSATMAPARSFAPRANRAAPTNASRRSPTRSTAELATITAATAPARPAYALAKAISGGASVANTTGAFGHIALQRRTAMRETVPCSAKQHPHLAVPTNPAT